MRSAFGVEHLSKALPPPADPKKRKPKTSADLIKDLHRTSEGDRRATFRRLTMVAKGLPSSVSRTPLGSLQPLSVGAAKKQAHRTGKKAAKAEAVYQQRRGSKFNLGDTGLRAIAGEVRNQGRAQGRVASGRVAIAGGAQRNQKRRVLP